MDSNYKGSTIDVGIGLTSSENFGNQAKAPLLPSKSSHSTSRKIQAGTTPHLLHIGYFVSDIMLILCFALGDVLLLEAFPRFIDTYKHGRGHDGVNMNGGSFAEEFSLVTVVPGSKPPRHRTAMDRYNYTLYITLFTFSKALKTCNPFCYLICAGSECT